MAINARNNIRLTWAQQQAVPLGGAYSIYGGIDAVSYAAALAGGIPAWPAGGQTGLGFGTLGGGFLGMAQGGNGLGAGRLGLGPLGVGGGALSLALDALADGHWHFAVVGADAAGNEVTPAASDVSLTLAGDPRPPTQARASYVAGTGIVTLTWATSPDDE